MIVDTLGWKVFVDWFYDSHFRCWWQLNGCVGVPLYKVYKRNSEWRRQVAPLTEDELNNNEIYNFKPASRLTSTEDTNNASDDTSTATANRLNGGSSVSKGVSIVDATLGLDTSRRKKNYSLEKDDSIDELVKAIKAPRKRVEISKNLLLF
jgi:hypothetical protein